MQKGCDSRHSRLVRVKSELETPPGENYSPRGKQFGSHAGDSRVRGRKVGQSSSQRRSEGCAGNRLQSGVERRRGSRDERGARVHDESDGVNQSRAD